jgi:glycosyltransferase involved in cell wall biosynthesis
VTATQNITTPFILTPLKALVAFIYKHCDWLLMSSMAFERKILPLITQPEKLLYWPQWAENFYGPHLTNPHIPYFINLPKGFYIFFAGNIGEAQSFPTILETAFILKKYTDIYWVIIGDGRKKAWVLKKVKDLNLESQFHFIGPQPPSLIPSYFYYADALLISLKKDPIFELTIPSKLQSSLACGLPILGSIDGEGARIIEEAEAGLCAPSESASQLADIVLQMKSQSPQERQLYGKKGRDYFKKYFDREKMIHQFLHWVEEHQEHRKKRSSNPTNQVQTHVSTNHSA